MATARIISAAAAAFVATVAFAVPAYAATGIVYEGSDYTQAVTDYYAVACDKEQDGNGVYGRVTGADSRGYRTWNLADGNGSAAGCGSVTTDRPITIIEICEDDLGVDTCRNKFLT